jgi:Leucine-rich repeat (LRR) protein
MGAAVAAAAAVAGVDAVTGRLAALSATGGSGGGGQLPPLSSSPPSPPPTPAVRRGGAATPASMATAPPRPPPFPPTLAPTFGTSIRVLDLSRSGLAAVPPAAASLTALTELRLRGVTAYPGTGFDWASLARTGHSLRVLDVSGCHLETLPIAALAALPFLRELVAKEVGLVSLDPVLSAGLPPGLRVLRLDGNRLPLLPAAALAALPALEVVSLTDNLAMQLPPDLARLAGLRHLRRLDARKVARGLCGARPWTARSMWHLARAYADLAAADAGRDWSVVLLL